MFKENAPSIGFCALCLGLVGFVAGFFGPIILNPQANQGPLLGIFITGPGGAIGGLILGFIFKKLPLPVSRKWQVLISITSLFVITILYFCLPEPEPHGYVVEAKINSCRLVADIVDAEIKRREADALNYTYYQPRAGWQAEIRDKAMSADGVILNAQVLRQRHVSIHQKPWNKGKLLLGAWQQVDGAQDFYSRMAGNSCSNYQMGSTGFYIADYEITSSRLWPPENLVTFLLLQVMDVAPQNYLQP